MLAVDCVDCVFGYRMLCLLLPVFGYRMLCLLLPVFGYRMLCVSDDLCFTLMWLFVLTGCEISCHSITKDADLP